MAEKEARLGELIALSRIEHGELVDGKNVVKAFEVGEVVTLKPEVIKGLVACGAVKRLEAEQPE